MKIVETSTGTVWLDIPEFARKQNKNPETIRRWIVSGFAMELGFVIHRDPTGHWRIGIPRNHQSYPQFS